MTHPTRLTDVLVVGLLAVALNCKPAPEKSGDITPSTQNIPPTERVAENAPTDLGGTSWRLVKFQGSDETTLRPDDPAKYTIAFGTDGRLSARIDCNRGRGTWKSSGPPQLEFGPLAFNAHDVPARIAARPHCQAVAVRALIRNEGRAPVCLADG